MYSNNLPEVFKKKWNVFLEKHPEKTIFQSHDIYSFYRKVPNYKPFVFYTEGENKEITGILLAVMIKEGSGLKGYFSSRVVVYGGPLIENIPDRLGVLDNLLAQLIQKLKKKSIFIQFRNFFEWNEKEKSIFKKHKFLFKNHLNLLIETLHYDKVWRDISPARRRQINKGLRSGVQVVTPENIEEVRAFYHLLKRLYQHKVRKPLPGWPFFKTFYEFANNGRLGIILVLKKESKVIGGILIPVTSGKNIYEWYVTGKDNEHKKEYPSVLATWAAIQFALQNNLQHFDFMGLGIPDKPYGVRDFKMKFGGRMVNYGRFGRRNNKWLYQMAELGYNLLRLLQRIR